MINWSKYFDHIFCLLYVNDNRYESIKNEFERIGILNSGIFEWIYDVNEPFKKDVIDALPNNLILPQHKSVTYQHFKLWHLCKYFNYNRVLIFEDDVRFLKDIDKIEKILNETIQEDITLYDYVIDFSSTSSVNNFSIYHLASAYSLNQKGLDVMIDNLTYNFDIVDRYFFTDNIEGFYIKNDSNKTYSTIINHYAIHYGSYSINISSERICIQADNGLYDAYKSKINWEDYNL